MQLSFNLILKSFPYNIIWKLNYGTCFSDENLGLHYALPHVSHMQCY